MARADTDRAWRSRTVRPKLAVATLVAFHRLEALEGLDTVTFTFGQWNSLHPAGPLNNVSARERTPKARQFEAKLH